MNIDKIYEYKHKLQEELNFGEISKYFMMNKTTTYQLLRDIIDIFTQMTKGRKFEKNYLKDKMKW